MSDFTIKTYTRLLEAFKSSKYGFQTFEVFLHYPQPRSIVLRHDVDLNPGNSLRTARIEHELGIRGTYNFRIVPGSRDEGIIREIAGLGHEIGYHYEEMATYKGDREKAWEAFRQNLEKLRKVAPVSTICMHGSPRSRYDSRDLWKTYNFRELGIIGEPYFDVDFSKTLYLTDTGRRWDGHRSSVRDRVDDTRYRILKENGFPIRKTKDIIRAAGAGILPDRIMITVHPQRWHSAPLPWLGELLLQNTKNVVKRILNTTRLNQA